MVQSKYLTTSKEETKFWISVEEENSKIYQMRYTVAMTMKGTVKDNCVMQEAYLLI